MPAKKEVNLRLIVKFLGILLMILSATMLFPMVWSLIYREQDSLIGLGMGMSLTFLSGVLLVWLTRRYDHRNIGKKEGYLVVSLTWISISVFGALPAYLSGAIPSYTDAFFETISGFTTTGATILNDIEAMPRGLLFWRSMTHWLGGMGIIVLTLAILPILGVGGMQLFVAEAPGTTPSRLHPRITETAKRLWGIYLLFTLTQTLLLMLGGMDLFDGLCHAFSTMATGGFSTRNDSIAGFSPYIQYVIILFMLLAGTSFSLHYFLLKGQFKKVLDNEELRFYLSLTGLFTLFIAVSIIVMHHTGVEPAFREALFQTVSIVTTTGFITADYLQWDNFIWFALFLLMFTGGCIGSTGGGVKMIRLLVLFKNTRLEMKRLLHPMAVIPVRINGRSIPPDIIHNFLAFFLLYILLFVAGSAIMTVFGLDFASAIGASVATIGNIGPAIGSVGPVDTYAHIPAGGKWVLSFFMLLGRLEIFTVLLVLSPSFWRK
jgi:trk system potassium uptake protein TrkH